MIVGIDVSKDKLDIQVLPMNRYFQIKNTKAAIRSFFKNKLLKLGTLDLVVFESTGGYEKTLMVYLMEAKLPFHRAHPNRVYHFAQGKGLFAKTDRIDANVLARYGEERDIEADTSKDVESIKLQELSSRKCQLKEMIAQEKQRGHGVYINTQIQRSIKRSIKQNKKELEMIEGLIEEAIKSDKKLEAKRELLKTIVGVGHEVATIVVTDMPELGKLSREEISHLVGVAPQTKDSGTKQGYRAIGRGRFHVRKALYMSALVGMRHNKKLRPIYERLIARGKEPKVALVALMRKLIIMMNSMVRDNRPCIQQVNLT